MICDKFNDLQDNYGAAYLLLCQTSRNVPIVWQGTNCIVYCIEYKSYI